MCVLQVVKAWQATPTTSGEVAVTGLSPGTHYFVCSLGNHCQRGMKVNVTVTTGDQYDDSSITTGTVCTIPFLVNEVTTVFIHMFIVALQIMFREFNFLLFSASTLCRSPVSPEPCGAVEDPGLLSSDHPPGRQPLLLLGRFPLPTSGGTIETV